MRISEYENFVTIPDREHIANQDDELTNEMAQRFYDAAINKAPTIIKKLSEKELDALWAGLFEQAKNEKGII